MHLGMMIGSLDDIVNEMHDHTRKSVFTLPEPRGLAGGIVECGIGPEHYMTVEYTKHFADTAAAVGAEALIIDAGRYCPPGTECKEWRHRTGDWIPDPVRYPNGIEEIRDCIHGKGLLFGLWATIDQAGGLSKLVEEHPDWVITAPDGTQTNLLDL